MKIRKKQYALYKGEEVLAIGTAKEISEKLNITIDTLFYYGTPAYKKKLANRKCSGNVRELIKLDD